MNTYTCKYENNDKEKRAFFLPNTAVKLSATVKRRPARAFWGQLGSKGCKAVLVIGVKLLTEVLRTHRRRATRALLAAFEPLCVCGTTTLEREAREFCFGMVVAG